MRYEPSTYKRCIREGYDYWGTNGPAKSQCPYHHDDRAGAWNFGRTHARQGYSREQTWQKFRENEGLAT